MSATREEAAAQPEPNQEELIQAVIALVNAPTLDESRQVIERQQATLFSNRADSIFGQLLAQYRDNEEIVAQIQEQWKLLRLSREKGTEVAFSEQNMRAVGDGLPAGLLSRLQAVKSEQDFYATILASPLLQRRLLQVGLALLDGPTWAERKLVVQTYPEILLSEAADYLLLFMETNFSQDPKLRQDIEACRELLRNARKDGIETAFGSHLAQEQMPGRESPQTSPDQPELPAAVINILRELAVEPYPASDLPRRIALTREGLQHLDREQQPKMWWFFHNQLGVYLSEDPSGEQEENLEQAIRHHQMALGVIEQQTQPGLWAATAINLGWDYYRRVRGDLAENLERALQLFSMALPLTERDSSPLEWARLQNGLGAAYQNRVLGEPDQNRQKAIQHYQSALNVLTAESHPLEWASMQNNLGTVYSDHLLSDGPQPSTSRTARVAADVRIWNTADEAKNQERAIDHFTRAMQVLTKANYPQLWADLQLNLGNVYLKRLNGERKANLEQAIESYEKALEVYVQEVFPQKWARGQVGLGEAYNKLGSQDPERNLERATKHYRAALQVFSLRTFSDEYRDVQIALGDLYFSNRQWQLAVEAYQSSLAVAEDFYQASATSAARRAAINVIRTVITNCAYALTKAHHPDQAVTLLETWLARVFGESLSYSEAVFLGASESQLQALKSARKQVAELEAEALNVGEPGSRDYAAISTNLRAAREELLLLLAAIRPNSPTEPALSQNVAKELRQPLVYLVATSVGGVALIISPTTWEISAEQIVWLESLKPTALQNAISESYQASDEHRSISSDPVSIMKDVVETAQPLIERWITRPVISSLQKMGYNRAYLIPTRGIGLWPLPSTVLPEATFSYAPSARMLRSAMLLGRNRSEKPPILFGVGNPLPSPMPLRFAGEEVKTIALQFPSGASRILVENQATRPQVIKELVGATHLHFACHAVFGAEEVFDSALLLSGNDQITLRDLLEGELDLTSARLVVLSACNTAVTATIDVSPEEALGFPATFLAAGVLGVISTLWMVDDLATTILMNHFYQLYLSGKWDPLGALAAAQVWLRSATVEQLDLVGKYQHTYPDSSKINPEIYRLIRFYQANPQTRPYEHPFYWAGFVYYGVSA